jgi:hypothetical protein
MFEPVPDATDVAGRLAVYLGQSRAANRLVGLAVFVDFVPTRDAVVLPEPSLGDGLGWGIEVRSEFENARVDEVVLGGATEDVYDWRLLVTAALDSVIHLHDGNFDSRFDLREQRVAGVDVAGVVPPVASDGLCFRLRWPVVIVVVRETPEFGLAHVALCLRSPVKTSVVHRPSLRWSGYDDVLDCIRNGSLPSPSQ